MEKSVFSQGRSTSENLNIFITRDETFYDIYKKNRFILSFLSLACHNWSLKTKRRKKKQHNDVDLIAYHKDREKQIFRQIKHNFDTRMFRIF